jgi:adenine-specific DNA-methyltransferase
MLFESRPNELPSEYADRLGKFFIAKSSSKYRKSHGQFMTPIDIARFMAMQSTLRRKNLRILDPGAGVGILSSSICEYYALRRNPESIRLVAYETDKNLISLLTQSLNFLKKYIKKIGIDFEFCIKSEDFILSNADRLNDLPLFHDMKSHNDEYDMVIANPPYFKIAKSDPRARLASSLVHGQPNIYALFMGISASLLKSGGQLTFITPRSFASGAYFKKFRNYFLNLIHPIKIHIFESRREAFKEDSVLQENIILTGAKKSVRTSTQKAYVSVSSSIGTTENNAIQRSRYSLSLILQDNNSEKIIRIPTAKTDEYIISKIESWRSTFIDYGIKISTGPVVPFRAKSLITSNGKIGAKYVPLIWMNHVLPMLIKWPNGSKDKPFLIKRVKESKKLLVAKSNYVLLRRFSTKEDKHRLVAAPLLYDNIPTTEIGLENHLNYIYRPNGKLTKEEALGIAVILNSSIYDRYFRIINGNTQVSATEIRDFPMPPLDVICKIGNLINDKSIVLADYDTIFEKFL